MPEAKIECPLPSRRQIHGHSDLDASTPRKRQSHVTRRVARGGVLAVLLATTVAIPLSGFVGAQSSVELPARALGISAGDQSWATTTVVAQSQALEGSVTAASRTRVRAPLTLNRCLPSAQTAAGNRDVQVRSSEIYWPMPPGTFEITSPFSMRVSPISGQLQMHEGIDMAGPLGTPLHAVYGGEVVEVSENSHSGALVKLKHVREDGSIFYSAYLHQYMDQIKVRVGDSVEAGQVIGAVGNNGWSTGPHLHFEIHNSNDEPIDPEAWLKEVGAVYLGEQACS